MGATTGMDNDGRLPGFVIIGAIKAATTWTAHQLRQNPAVFMPGPEPHYFSTEYDRGRHWYAGLFAPAATGRTAGEKSADYLSHPRAAVRMAALLPHARLVVQLRNPIDRAYSDYCMLFRRGAVSGDPARYLRPTSSENRRFLENGLYATHLQRFMDHFPAHAIRTLLHDDIVAAPEAAIRAVCAHIGIAAWVDPNHVGSRENDSEAPLLPLGLRRLARPFKNLVRPYRDEAWFRAVRGTLARPVAYPPLTGDLRRILAEYYRPDLERLERMIGRDLNHWTRSGEAEGVLREGSAGRQDPDFHHDPSDSGRPGHPPDSAQSGRDMV